MRSRYRWAALLSLIGCPLWSQSDLPAARMERGAFPIPNTLHIRSEQSLREALAAPFPNVYRVEAGPQTRRTRATVDNCLQYLALPKEDIETGSTLDDRTLLSLGVDCVTLAWMRAALASSPSRPRERFTFRQVALRQLPPELALSLSIDERKKAAEASRKEESILALEPGVEWRKRNGETATLLLPGYWTEHLEIHAQGDFLGNGDEQVVVRADTQVIGGSYQSTYLFLLERTNGKLIVVRKYPEISLPEL